MSVERVDATAYLNLMFLKVRFVFEIHVVILFVVVVVVLFFVVRWLWSVPFLDVDMVRVSE